MIGLSRLIKSGPKFRYYSGTIAQNIFRCVHRIDSSIWVFDKGREPLHIEGGISWTRSLYRGLDYAFDRARKLASLRPVPVVYSGEISGEFRSWNTISAPETFEIMPVDLIYVPESFVEPGYSHTQVVRQMCAESVRGIGVDKFLEMDIEEKREAFQRYLVDNFTPKIYLRELPVKGA